MKLLSAFTFFLVQWRGGVAISSCRPTCMAFQVDRLETECRRSGAFASEPWRSFLASPCDGALAVPEELTIWINEGGNHNVATTRIDLGTNDVFTYCSVYECPTSECAIPEQFGSMIQFELYDGASEDLVILLTWSLSIDFAGTAISDSTRFGPLILLWMDDPFLCRPDLFPGQEINHVEDDDLSVDVIPTAFGGDISDIFDGMAFAEVEQTQRKALKSFFLSTHMESNFSRPLHNWFLDDHDQDGTKYCSFTGVGCNLQRLVVTLDLVGLGLSGSLPESISGLGQLQRIRLPQNKIGGKLPQAFVMLTRLRQVNLENNSFTGQLPEDISKLTKLQVFRVGNNQFESTIPQGFCELPGLNTLDIADNQGIIGAIPSCLGALDTLRTLGIRNLDLIGYVPSGLCEPRQFNDVLKKAFGCDAVACPSGTFLPGTGRQSSASLPCLPCVTPSNVIGSTSCRLVYADAPSAALLSSHNQSEALSVSSFNSLRSPTMNSRDIPSYISSLEPTSMTSPFPSLAPASAQVRYPSILTSDPPTLHATLLSRSHGPSTTEPFHSLGAFGPSSANTNTPSYLTSSPAPFQRFAGSPTINSALSGPSGVNRSSIVVFVVGLVALLAALVKFGLISRGRHCEQRQAVSRFLDHEDYGCGSEDHWSDAVPGINSAEPSSTIATSSLHGLGFCSTFDDSRNITSECLFNGGFTSPSFTVAEFDVETSQFGVPMHAGSRSTESGATQYHTDFFSAASSGLTSYFDELDPSRRTNSPSLGESQLSARSRSELPDLASYFEAHGLELNEKDESIAVTSRALDISKHSSKSRQSSLLYPTQERSRRSTKSSLKPLFSSPYPSQYCNVNNINEWQDPLVFPSQSPCQPVLRDADSFSSFRSSADSTAISSVTMVSDRRTWIPILNLQAENPATGSLMMHQTLHSISDASISLNSHAVALPKRVKVKRMRYSALPETPEEQAPQGFVAASKNWFRRKSWLSF